MAAGAWREQLLLFPRPSSSRVKEERITELETENALLHLKLAECREMVRWKRHNADTELPAPGHAQPALPRGMQPVCVQLSSTIQKLKQDLGELRSTSLAMLKDLQAQAQDWASEAMTAAHSSKLCSEALQACQSRAALLERSLQEVSERYDREKQARKALHNTLVVSRVTRTGGWGGAQGRQRAVAGPFSVSEIVPGPQILQVKMQLLLELRGSIRVHCRIRPLLPFDSSFDDGGQPDRVYSPAEGQDAVFEDVRPLLTSLLDGYNVCIMAHGQTGSGKSHTMLGLSSAVGKAPLAGARQDLGVIPRAAEELFRLLSESPPRRPEAEVSIVEVYNNEVFDLLTRDRATASRTQREGKDLVGATRQMVHSAAEFMSLVAGSLQLRVKHPTLVHADSSRSHLIITVTLPVATSPDSSGHRPNHPPGRMPTCPSPRSLVREKQRVSSPVFPSAVGFGGPSALLEHACAQLQLVDLAGSECAGVSGVTGPALREASCINRSLAALGDVLGALWEHRSHVPYRNSRLTHLLKDGIGGDAKLLVVLCVSPCPEHLVSTLQTLSFGARARQVQWGSVGSRGPRPPGSPREGGVRLNHIASEASKAGLVPSMEIPQGVSSGRVLVVWVEATPPTA
ncbi:kinesin-like protein KIF25 [Tenrec ecaudatus]|uniref:kinesin-like protein KIF25 n=1 Tax=Tenrec ecaudatus TaxID=94439 RepID=UPI003F5A8AFB